MFHNKPALIGIYSQLGTSAGPVLGGIITNFSVGTTSGQIFVSWGDGTAQTLSPFLSAQHQYYCPDSSAPAGFWNSMTVCI
jgi:hypothetical protein